MRDSITIPSAEKRNKFFTIAKTANYIFLACLILCFEIADESKILSYVVNTNQQEIKLYYKNKNGQPYRSIQNLKNDVDSQNKQLIFAMNGGMYQRDNSPLGLYIENKKLIAPLNTKSGSGNFYLKPNGIFYIDIKNKPHVCTTKNFKNKNVAKIKYCKKDDGVWKIVESYCIGGSGSGGPSNIVSDKYYLEKKKVDGREIKAA